jgi:hypothetical protein
MTPFKSCLTSALLLAIATVAFAVEPQSDGFRSIFNAKDLTGWIGNNPHQTMKASADKRAEAIAAQQEQYQAHWRVENGDLVNDGHGPYATTVEEFGDIELRIDYKTVAKADSGIYLRGTPQIQIWDYTKEGGKWDRNADKGSGGLFNNTRGTPGQLPLVLADKAFGEWNQFRILQIGSRTTVHLNDKLVSSSTTRSWRTTGKRTAPFPYQLVVRSICKRTEAKFAGGTLLSATFQRMKPIASFAPTMPH